MLETTLMKLDRDVILTADDMCDWLQIGPSTLTKLEKEEGLPVHRLGSGPKAPRRYLQPEVVEWFKSRCSVRSGAA
jgi:hypothetical protein